MKTAVNIILQANLIIHRSWLFTGYSSGFVKSRIYFASSLFLNYFYSKAKLHCVNYLFVYHQRNFLLFMLRF